MCGSMVYTQCATDEIRRGKKEEIEKKERRKKEERKKKNEPQDEI